MEQQRYLKPEDYDWDQKPKTSKPYIRCMLLLRMVTKNAIAHRYPIQPDRRPREMLKYCASQMEEAMDFNPAIFALVRAELSREISETTEWPQVEAMLKDAEAYLELEPPLEHTRYTPEVVKFKSE